MTASADSTPGKQGVAARQVAVAIVMEVHQQRAWASPVADRILGRSGLDAQDRAFATNLAFQTIRWEGTLDWILTRFVSRGLESVEPALLDVLRVACWELRYGSQPGHAVVDSAVEVARSVVGARSTGFVNGVLRNVVRRADALDWPGTDTDEGLGLAHGYPAWIASQARERFGAGRAEAVLAAGNVPGPLVLRAVASREEVLQALADDGIRAAPGELAHDAVVLSERADPGRLAVVADGRATVQDQASQVVGQLAAEGLPAGALAIDLCAAPGGKATHLAQQGLDVLAVDRHAGRLRRAADLAERLGLRLRTHTADGTDPGLPEASADLVLVDAPCSGLGVVRRRPELRWRRDPGDPAALAQIQLALLTAAARLVKPGGRITYAVCTWTVKETDQVVANVLRTCGLQVRRHPSVGTATEFGAQLAPDVDEADGMYVAELERREGTR